MQKTIEGGRENHGSDASAPSGSTYIKSEYNFFHVGETTTADDKFRYVLSSLFIKLLYMMVFGYAYQLIDTVL